MLRRQKVSILIVLHLILGGSATCAADEEETTKDLATIARSLMPSAVKVEYTLQYDKGDAPGLEQVIREERPSESSGFLISPTLVVTDDPGVHPRFIKQIQVRHGDQVVDAAPFSYSIYGNVLILELESPLDDRKPLTFGAKVGQPAYCASYYRSDGVWQLHLRPVRRELALTDDGLLKERGYQSNLFMDREGRPIAFCEKSDLPIDEVWKASPMERPQLSQADYDTVLKKIEGAADLCLPRIELSFRSPRQGTSDPFGMGYYGQEEESETEWHGTGLLLDDQMVLIPASFKRDRTARLEKILVHTMDGQTVEGVFAGSLKDYGAMVATLAEPLSGATAFYEGDILKLLDKLLIAAEVTVHGENRIAYFDRGRITGFNVSWEGRDYPDFPARSWHSGGYWGYGSNITGSNYLFSMDGELVAIPLERREKVTVEERWGGDEPIMTPVAYIQPVLDDWDNNLDVDNKPLSEEEENRLAWLGVELQAMTQDLARMNNISHLTSGGGTGAIITYVYENSPAAKAELELGDILLRLHVEGHPKPLDVMVDQGYGFGFDEEFWQYFDEVPLEYFDQMPQPWGGADNPLNRALTELGFGTPFTAEIYRLDETIMVDFTVEQGPPYYLAAKRFESEDLGLTVRSLTYEVRRYYQLTEDEPGVIISKVKPGEKAGVAGLRPYELIISVDGTPIKSPDDFELAAQKTGDLQLFVKRMTDGRTVKSKAAWVEETDPSEADEAAEQSENEG